MAYAHYAGIDVAAETHALAAVAADGAPSLKPTPFAEDRDGYALMSAKLDGLRPVLVVMEATGHYWRNLFAALAAALSPFGDITYVDGPGTQAHSPQRECGRFVSA